MARYYPTLRDLVCVIPVAQSQTRDDTTLTVLSLDWYADGWVANLRVHRDDPRYYPVFTFHPKADVRRTHQFGGSGSFSSWHHRDGDPNWYFSVIFYPALAPDDALLEFIVRVIRFNDRPAPTGDSRLQRSLARGTSASHSMAMSSLRSLPRTMPSGSPSITRSMWSNAGGKHCRNTVRCSMM